MQVCLRVRGLGDSEISKHFRYVTASTGAATRLPYPSLVSSHAGDRDGQCTTNLTDRSPGLLIE